MKTDQFNVISTMGGIADSVIPVDIRVTTDVIRTLDSEEISLVAGGPEGEVTNGAVEAQ